MIDKDDGRPRRIIILATDVVESCVTIPECKIVVNMCTHKRKRRKKDTHLWLGMDTVQPELTLERITKDEALQRRRRTGRTCAGVAYHLILSNDYKNLKDHPTPEMESADVADVLLTLQDNLPRLGDTFPKAEDFLTRCMPSPTPPSSIRQAHTKLLEMGAVVNVKSKQHHKLCHPYSLFESLESSAASGERIMFLGKLLQVLPYSPDIILLVFNGLRYGVLEHAEVIAAIPMRGSPFYDNQSLEWPTEKLDLASVKMACSQEKQSVGKILRSASVGPPQ